MSLFLYSISLSNPNSLINDSALENVLVIRMQRFWMVQDVKHHARILLSLIHI